MSAPAEDPAFTVTAEAESYLAEHDRESSGVGLGGFVLAILGGVAVAVSLIGGML